jgi:hypothetical protein
LGLLEFVLVNFADVQFFIQVAVLLVKLHLLLFALDLLPFILPNHLIKLLTSRLLLSEPALKYLYLPARQLQLKL